MGFGVLDDICYSTLAIGLGLGLLMIHIRWCYRWYMLSNNKKEACNHGDTFVKVPRKTCTLFHFCRHPTMQRDGIFLLDEFLRLRVKLSKKVYVYITVLSVNQGKM